MSLSSKFDERVEEIDLYFSFLRNLDEKKAKLQITGKRTRSLTPKEDLLKILKANVYLLLYNLIESSMRSGLLAIYDSIKADGVPYVQLVQELQRVWVNNVLSAAPDRAAENTATKVHELITQVVEEEIVTFDPQKLRISGNVDARRVRALCEEHGFSHTTRGVKGGNRLVHVKTERNNLAHGHTSFIESGRNITLGDLDAIRKQVVSFMRQILRNVERYISAKKYIQI